MKVILLENIRNIGRVGDVKEVSDGYYRNFLLPQRKARPASEGAVKDIETLKAKKLQATQLRTEQAKIIAQKIAGMAIELHARANSQGTLFAGIEAKDIATALLPAIGERIPDEAILLDGHIKTVGEHAVSLELAEGVPATVTVRVLPE